LVIQEHLRKITDRRTKATLEIKAFDTILLTGVKLAGVLFDELHEIPKNPAAERLIGQLRGGLLPNPEGFLMFITTQSDEPPRGAFRSELMMARAIGTGGLRVPCCRSLMSSRRTSPTTGATSLPGRIRSTGGW
jgi:phage terminase large subunit-like protein